MVQGICSRVLNFWCTRAWLFKATPCSFLAWIKCTILFSCPSWDYLLLVVNLCMVSFIFFTSDHAIDPYKICDGSLLACPLWFYQFPSRQNDSTSNLHLHQKERELRTLKVGDKLYLLGRFSLYYLSFIFSRTWNDLSPPRYNFGLLWVEKCSFCICSQTESIGSNITLLFPLLASEA